MIICNLNWNARSFTIFLHKYPKLEVILLTVDGIVLLTLGPFPGTATAGLVVNGRGFLFIRKRLSDPSDMGSEAQITILNRHLHNKV